MQKCKKSKPVNPYLGIGLYPGFGLEEILGYPGFPVNLGCKPYRLATIDIDISYIFWEDVVL